ncbi:MAG: TonB-dependent receptor [Chitinophagales bacterium]
MQRILTLLCFFVCLNSHTEAQQNCSIKVRLKITDARTGLPLEYAMVRFSSNANAGYTDATGKIDFTTICALKDTIECTHLGCDAIRFAAILSHDTTFKLALNHKAYDLHEVNVTRDRSHDLATMSRMDVSSRELLQHQGNTLGETLKEIAGVNSIQTGPTISKPVIHGLSGNRILIINNGIRQEGQQWGSEHGPELDLALAQHIEVIKGAASIKYGSDAIGGVILTTPNEMPTHPGIGANFQFTGASNGRMGVISALVEGAFGKKLSGWSWRAQGSIKAAGNYHTNAYYLENTGMREYDFSGCTAYHRSDFGITLFASSYDSKIGIFSGSEVETPDELYAAFARSRPNTPSYFSYRINHGYQRIRHQLYKVAIHYHFRKAGKLELVYAYQNNKRSEFESALSNYPAVSDFSIQTHTIQADFQHRATKYFSGNLGWQSIIQNNSIAGLEYLMPNHRIFGSGIYWIERFSLDGFTAEAGIRYDFRRQALSISDTVGKPVRWFQDATINAGLKYETKYGLTLLFNFGTAWRAPGVSEQYINGVHLSAASFDTGDPNLQLEKAYNNTFEIQFKRPRFQVVVTGYYNYIHNFIYAAPMLQTITVDEGTFPLFHYRQVNADFTGIDIFAYWNFWKGFSLTSKFSGVRAWNCSQNEGLPYMPAVRFDNQLQYEFVKLKKAEQLYVRFGVLYVDKKQDVNTVNDYVAPPKPYALLRAGIGVNLPVRKQKIVLDFVVENLSNTAYRDYLNRFRYFSNDLGRNFILRAQIPLSFYK